MQKEEEILYGIKCLEESNSTTYSLNSELGTLNKIDEGKYKLNCSKTLLPFQFKFLLSNPSGDSIELSFPTNEDCDKLTLSLSQDEKLELNQLKTYGSELLYKIGVGLLHISNQQKG